MYIDESKIWKFLAEKISKKIFLIQISDSKITEKNIHDLTKKECDFIFHSEKYMNFKKEIFNTSVLDEVVFRSRFFGNFVQALTLEKNKKISGEEVFKKGKIIHSWMSDFFPMKFIFHSNNMEGSRIPEQEVEKIIQWKKHAYKIKNEIQEVKNSKKSWEFLQEKFIFNEANIKKLYHILTKNLLQENGNPYPRGFKKVVNVANNNSTTAPEKVSQEIIFLLKKYRETKNTVFSLQSAFDFHLRYEQIHPFENGNGRTGRFIMNKIFLQDSMMPMIVFRENYSAYANSIASCTDRNKKKYYTFMLEQYKKTLDMCEKFLKKI